MSSVRIDNIKFYNTLDKDGSVFPSTVTSPPADLLTNPDNPAYLRGGIGDKHWVGIECSVSWEVLGIQVETSAAEQSILLKEDTTGLPTSIIQNTAQANFITAGFEVGDIVFIFTLGAYTQYRLKNVEQRRLVVEQYTGTTLVPTQPSPLLGDNIGIGISIYGLTPINSVEARFKLIPNSLTPEFVSDITGIEAHTYKSDNVDTNGGLTEYELEPLGDSNWQIYNGTDRQCYVQGLGILFPFIYRIPQKFVLYYSFNNLPILADKLNEIGRLNPDLFTEFLGKESQKLAYDINFKTDIFDLNPRFTFSSNEQSYKDLYLKEGQTGYYGELYNDNKHTVEVSSVSYEIVSNGTPVDSLIKNEDTKVTITVTDTSLGGTGFFDISNDEGTASVYLMSKPNDTNTTDITKTFLENLNYNKITFDYSSTNFSSNLVEGSLMTAFTGTRTNDREIVFEFIVPATKNVFSNDQYMIGFNSFGTQPIGGVTIQLLADEADSVFDLPSYCSVTGLFEQHGGLTSDNVVSCIEDNILGSFNLKVDKTITMVDTYDIDLQTLRVEIVAEHATDSDRNFTLQSDSFNTGYSNYGTTNKGFELKNTDEFNQCVWVEGYAVETPTQKTYILKYPFKIRWEEWVGANADSDFEQTNFQDWSQFEQHPDWELKLNLVLESKATDQSTGESFINEQTKQFDFEINDYGETCDVAGFTATYTNLDIDIIDLDTSQPLSVIPKNRKVKIVATFEGDWKDTPEYPFPIYGMLRLDATTVGGINYNREISTIIDAPLGSEWFGITNSLRADITINDTTAPYPIVVEAILDGTKLDSNLTEFCLSGRIGATVSSDPAQPLSQLVGDVTLDALLIDVLLDPLLID